MENWLLFDDSRFDLQFSYPARATDGELVERAEIEQADMLRVHILSPKSREVYFEVSKFEGLTAEAEYRRHKEYLPAQFQSLTISKLRETLWASLRAYEYEFEWELGKRKVFLIEQGDVLYRVLYNPRFPVNLQILSTVEWLNRA